MASAGISWKNTKESTTMNRVWIWNEIYTCLAGADRETAFRSPGKCEEPVYQVLCYESYRNDQAGG